MATRELVVCGILYAAVLGWCLWRVWRRVREYYRNKPPLRDTPTE